MAISEISSEILFLRGMLEYLGLKVTYPIHVNVDNIGAIYLTKTATGSNRTKHVDTRYHFVREYIENGTIKVIYVQSKENDADIMTKNLSKTLYDKHCEKFVKKDDWDKKCDNDNDKIRKGVKTITASKNTCGTERRNLRDQKGRGSQKRVIMSQYFRFCLFLS